MRSSVTDEVSGETSGEVSDDMTATEARRLADLFRMLGDPGRVRILVALAEAGEMRVGDICVAVGAPETSVSHALRLLRTAGIVRNRREGRNVYYDLDDTHVRELLELSREHLSHGEPHA